jgi:son of sevenless
MKTFLMTYKSFTTLDELFELLVQRFRIQPPDGLDSRQLEEWCKAKQRIIQIRWVSSLNVAPSNKPSWLIMSFFFLSCRVINAFKTMIQDEDVLEKEDLYILDRIMKFVEEIKHFTPAKQLHNVIERAVRTLVTNFTRLMPMIGLSFFFLHPALW